MFEKTKINEKEARVGPFFIKWFRLVKFEDDTISFCFNLDDCKRRLHELPTFAITSRMRFQTQPFLLDPPNWIAENAHVNTIHFEKYSLAVWSDWAIFDSSWCKILLQKKPKCLAHFGLFKNYFLRKNECDYFLANFWKYLGYFLSQHLVTLLPSE